MIAVVAIGALVALALALVGRDVAIRYLADRADARVMRVSAAETTAAAAHALSREHEKKFRDLEQKLGALMAARVRK